MWFAEKTYLEKGVFESNSMEVLCVVWIDAQEMKGFDSNTMKRRRKKIKMKRRKNGYKKDFGCYWVLSRNT